MMVLQRLVGGLFGFGGREGSSARGENSRETTGARDPEFLSPEGTLEQYFYDLQAEHAKYRDEASRLLKERDDLRTQNSKLKKTDGVHRRRISELRESTKLFKAKFSKLQKTAGPLNTTILGLNEENRSLKTNIRGFQEEEKRLDECVRGLRGENENVRKDNEELRSWGIQLQKALREVQEREYAATKQQDIESHEAVSAQFGDLFLRCERWAWRYFRLGIGDFRIEEFPPFERELDLVSWSDANWKDKKHFKLSHLVQAVLGNILVRVVFKCPFAGCARDFRREFSDLYEVKLREGEPAAHRWRASSLTTYYQSANWPPIDGMPIETYRTDYREEIWGLLYEVLSPIIDTHILERTAGGNNFPEDELFAIIIAGMELATKMSQQPFKLVIIDKEWFHCNGRQFGRNDDRMKDRLGDGDDHPGEDLTVDLILTPGFLKHGNDDAEHLDQYSVWMPAKVDIRDSLGGNSPPKSGETQANEQVEVGDGQDFTPGPPADLLEDRSGNEEFLGEREDKSEEIL